MPDIQVNCIFCGKDFSVPEGQGGLSASCPHCQKQISVPAAAEQLAAKPGMQITRDRNVDGAKRCPSCGAGMSAGAVLCIQCGYDARTGLVLGASKEKLPASRLLMWAAGVVIAAGLINFLLKPSQNQPEPIPREPSPAQASTSSGAPAIPAALPAPAAPSNAAPVSAAATEASADSNAAFSAAEPPVKSPADDPAVVESLRLKLFAQLDERSPLYQAGSTVALRRVNGMVHRGVFAGLEGTNVALMVSSNRVLVPVAALDGATRLQCETAFRSKWVEYYLQRQLKSMAPP